MERQVERIDLEAAFNCTDLGEFLLMVFPKEWAPVAARIVESGAYFVESKEGEGGDKFAPRWTPVPLTVRKSKRGLEAETQFKSIIFRVHDCLHQLWGLPVPRAWDETERYYFKRMWMCAEVAVLTITEFFYCQWLHETQPHLRAFLENRNTLLFKNTTLLRTRTMLETANILDELLHKKIQPKWVRENPHALIFIEDFVAMLEYDRVNIDWNWTLLLGQKDKSYLAGLSTQRYSREKTGREFTEWLLADFQHTLATGTDIDEGLAAYNRKRRNAIDLPPSWNEATVLE